ncbi:DUF2071 domain-containing protein [Oceanobacillus chungangensis]|uniref:Uncharacterized protein n=1 Tax=Oceanobacillus chungangensis TaxID=1229152 RepID=A0A3D8PIM1_9BACI|nr:hypothetical protein CWR45_15515 [Oceanobacillus chungangensis]
MMQKWKHLLFISWPVSVEVIEGLIPQGLDLDTFEGKEWISINPFKVSQMRLRKLPPIPCLSSYLELNVRTYVKCEGVSREYFLV